MMPYESQVAQTALVPMLIFLVLIFAIAAVEIVGRVIFSLGVYKDAQGNYNQNPLMWALLVGFLGLIPLIIYFCLRKNNSYRVACPHCRNILQTPTASCPFCHNAIDPSAIPAENPAYIELRRKGKKQMIAGGILIGISYVLAIVFLVLFFVWFATFTTSQFPSTYSYSFDNYDFWDSALTLFRR